MAVVLGQTAVSFPVGTQSTKWGHYLTVDVNGASNKTYNFYPANVDQLITFSVLFNNNAASTTADCWIAAYVVYTDGTFRKLCVNENHDTTAQSSWCCTLSANSILDNTKRTDSGARVFSRIYLEVYQLFGTAAFTAQYSYFSSIRLS